jgi:hypothetical protein
LNNKSTKQTEEQIKQQAIKEYQESQTYSVMEFAKQMQQIMIESMSTKNKIKFYRKYKPEEVDKYLLDPAQYEKQLREISRYLAVSSPQYWRLINYFPSIAILNPVLVPFDNDKLTKNKSKTLKMFNECTKKLDNMNIQHEFLKVLQTVFREDIFYGYEIETENSYYIKALDPQYCRPKGKYDGCFTYEFDFSYFDAFKTENELAEYTLIDREFLIKYNKYKENSSYRWQELNLDKEICVKYQDTFDFCCPPYISVFNDLYDISDFKDMNKAKVEMDNTKFVGFEMPIKKDSQRPDDFTLEVETMKTYFAFIQSCLQGKVGAFMSPMPFKEISFPTQKSDVDNVAQAVKSFWGATGVADVLVGENKNAGTLKYSILTDEAILFNVFKQIGRILSRKFKQISNGMFMVTIPELTIFNIGDEFDKYLKASQYGYQGARTMVEATMKLTQNQVQGLGYIENELLNKKDNMFPVTSSYTMTGNESGAPAETDDTKVSDSATQTRDSSANENR